LTAIDPIEAVRARDVTPRPGEPGGTAALTAYWVTGTPFHAITLLAAVRTKSSTLADRVAFVPSPTWITNAGTAHWITTLPVSLLTITGVCAVDAEPAAFTVHLALPTLVPRRTSAKPCDVMTGASIFAGALLLALCSPPSSGAGCVAEDSAPPGGAATFPARLVAPCSVRTLALVFAVTSIVSIFARLITILSQPARAAGAGSVDAVAVGAIRARAHRLTAGTVGVDPTRPVAMVSGVSWFADALPCPRIAKFCVFRVTSADE